MYLAMSSLVERWLVSDALCSERSVYIVEIRPSTFTLLAEAIEDEFGLQMDYFFVFGFSG